MLAAILEKQHFTAVNGRLSLSGEQPTCESADADPNHGTSDYAESIAALSTMSVGAGL